MSSSPVGVKYQSAFLSPLHSFHEKSLTRHIPEHSYSAHHDSSSLLVESHSNVLNTRWLYPVPCACCDSYSPLTAGMLVLCDELYAASSSLGDWCCVLRFIEKKNKCHFQFIKLNDDKVKIIVSQICLILMLFWEMYIVMSLCLLNTF